MISLVSGGISLSRAVSRSVWEEKPKKKKMKTKKKKRKKQRRKIFLIFTITFYCTCHRVHLHNKDNHVLKWLEYIQIYLKFHKFNI